MDRRSGRTGAARAERVRPAARRGHLGAAASELLGSESKWESFSQCSRQTVAAFNYDRAAAGILDAFAYLDGTPSAPHASSSR